MPRKMMHLQCFVVMRIADLEPIRVFMKQNTAQSWIKRQKTRQAYTIRPTKLLLDKDVDNA